MGTTTNPSSRNFFRKERSSGGHNSSKPRSMGLSVSFWLSLFTASMYLSIIAIGSSCFAFFSTAGFIRGRTAFEEVLKMNDVIHVNQLKGRAGRVRLAKVENFQKKPGHFGASTRYLFEMFCSAQSLSRGLLRGKHHIAPWLVAGSLLAGGAAAAHSEKGTFGCRETQHPLLCNVSM